MFRRSLENRIKSASSALDSLLEAARFRAEELDVVRREIEEEFSRLRSLDDEAAKKLRFARNLLKLSEEGGD